MGDQVQILAGTSGYSFKEWCGPFYPKNLPAADMLSHYASRFSTVEINNTFYRMPAEALLARWAVRVPPQFAFTLKAPRRITHEKRLVNASGDVAEFLRRAALLKDKLGALLFQLPPTIKKDVQRLRDFLELLPGGARMVFEFRHDSWQSEDVYETLRARGVLLCVTDTDDGETPFISTSDHAYLRLRRTRYSDADLDLWLNRIGGQPLTRVYAYFMHEDEARGTHYARRLLELWRARSGE